MNMGFGANKTHAELIKEGAFGGTYFRDIYSGVNSKWYRKSWKVFDELKNIDRRIITQIIMMLVLTNVVWNVEK